MSRKKDPASSSDNLDANQVTLSFSQVAEPSQSFYKEEDLGDVIKYTIDQKELFNAMRERVSTSIDYLRDVGTGRFLALGQELLTNSFLKQNSSIEVSRKKPVAINTSLPMQILSKGRAGLAKPDFIEWFDDQEKGEAPQDKIYKCFFGNKEFGGHLFANGVAQEEGGCLTIPILPYASAASRQLFAGELAAPTTIKLSNRSEVNGKDPAPVILSGTFLSLRHKEMRKSVPSAYHILQGAKVEEYEAFLPSVKGASQNILTFSVDPISSGEKDSPESVKALFDNSFAAFSHAKSDAKPLQAVIKGGLAGAGMFGNNPQFSVFMQYLAAKIAGVSIEFHGISAERALIVQDIMDKVDEITSKENPIVVNDVITRLLDGRIFGDKGSKNPEQGHGGWFVDYNYGPKIKKMIEEESEKARVLNLKEVIKNIESNPGVKKRRILGSFSLDDIAEYDGSPLNVSIDQKGDIAISVGTRKINLDPSSWKDEDRKSFSLLEMVITEINAKAELGQKGGAKKKQAAATEIPSASSVHSPVGSKGSQQQKSEVCVIS